MSKKITLEEAYFHICNGGVGIKIVEQHDEREEREYPPPVPNETMEETQRRLSVPLRIGTNYNRRWFVELKTSTFGASTTFRFPLGNPLFLAWLMTVLPRVLGRMMMDDGRSTDGFEYPFRNTFKANVTAWDGRKVKFDWPTTPEDLRLSDSDSGKSESSSYDVGSVSPARPLTSREEWEIARRKWIDVLKYAGLGEWMKAHMESFETMEERQRRRSRYAVAWRFSVGHPWSLATSKPLDGRWATPEEARDAIVGVVKNLAYSVEYAIADTHKDDGSGQPVVGIMSWYAHGSGWGTRNRELSGERVQPLPGDGRDPNLVSHGYNEDVQPKVKTVETLRKRR